MCRKLPQIVKLGLETLVGRNTNADKAVGILPADKQFGAAASLLMVPMSKIVGSSGEEVGGERDMRSIGRTKERVAEAGVGNVCFAHADVGRVTIGKPFSEFSRHILRIRSRTSRGTNGRPGWPRRTFQVQNRRKPSRCQATTISGWTMAIGRASYERSIILICSDISSFSRSTVTRFDSRPLSFEAGHCNPTLVP